MKKSSLSDILNQDRICPRPRLSEYNLEVTQMSEIFRDVRPYIIEIYKTKCKELVSEIIIMRGTRSEDKILQEEIKLIPLSIISGNVQSIDILDAIRDTFAILTLTQLDKKFPRLSVVYNGEITEDAREIVHLNNLLVAMDKGRSMACNFDNLARCMNYMSKDSGGKR